MEKHEEIEVNIREAKKMVDTGNALRRLEKNRDFKKIVLDGYLREEAVRLVHLKGAPNMQDEESQKQIEKMMNGIAGFTSYCRNIDHQGMLASKAIEDNEEELEGLLNEELS